MKKQFTCEKCEGGFWVAWTKGLCPTCRRREHYKENYKSNDRYSIHVGRVINAVDREDASGLVLYSTLSRHHPRFRQEVESYNDLKRRYYRGRL